MTSPSNPLDPELLKIPAFQRKKIIQQRVQKPVGFTVEDAIRSAQRDGIGDVEISSSLSRAQRQSQKPIPSFDSRPVQRKRNTRQGFGTFSLQQPLPQVTPAHTLLRTYVPVGVVTAVFAKIDVAIVKLSTGVRLGDILLFQDDETLYEERVDSMQINRKDIKTAKKGAEIGMKVGQHPRSGTKVYRIAPVRSYCE